MERPGWLTSVVGTPGRSIYLLIKTEAGMREAASGTVGDRMLISQRR